MGEEVEELVKRLRDSATGLAGDLTFGLESDVKVMREAADTIESLRASLTRVEEERDLEAAKARLFELFRYYFVSSGTPFAHVANVIVHDPKFLQAMGLSRASPKETERSE